jgi:hypothetical protein
LVSGASTWYRRSRFGRHPTHFGIRGGARHEARFDPCQRLDRRAT